MLIIVFSLTVAVVTVFPSSDDGRRMCGRERKRRRERVNSDGVDGDGVSGERAKKVIDAFGLETHRILLRLLRLGLLAADSWWAVNIELRCLFAPNIIHILELLGAVTLESLVSAQLVYLCSVS